MKHPEWVGGKPPAAVGGCCGRAAALTALRRVENAHDSSDTDGWRPPSLWTKSARMQTRPGDAAALARRPKREKAAATRTGRWGHVRCARGQGGKVAARPQQGGGYGLGAGGMSAAKHPRAYKAHPEWVGGKPPAAVGGCRGRAAALTALRRVDNAHDPSDTDGWRPPSLWAKSARMQTRPIDAAALARRPKREKVAATRTGRWDHVRCARGQGGKVAARPRQGGGHGLGAGGCGRQNTPVQSRGIPNGWEESPQRRWVAVAGSAVAAAA